MSGHLPFKRILTSINIINQHGLVLALFLPPSPLKQKGAVYTSDESCKQAKLKFVFSLLFQILNPTNLTSKMYPDTDNQVANILKMAQPSPAIMFQPIFN